MKTAIANKQTDAIQKTQQALLRAAENARQLTEKTGTQFVICSSTDVQTTHKK